MKKGYGLFSLILLSTTMLGACAQSRRGANAGATKDTVWATQQLCANETGQQVYACFTIAVNITANTAKLGVSQLGFDPASTPYRILARRQGDTNFQLLADNVTTAAGGSITIRAKSGQYIEEYETWRAELIVNYDAQDLQFNAPAGQGLAVMQAFVDYPELYTNN